MEAGLTFPDSHTKCLINQWATELFFKHESNKKCHFKIWKSRTAIITFIAFFRAWVNIYLSFVDPMKFQKNCCRECEPLNLSRRWWKIVWHSLNYFSIDIYLNDFVAIAWTEYQKSQNLSNFKIDPLSRIWQTDIVCQTVFFVLLGFLCAKLDCR